MSESFTTPDGFEVTSSSETSEEMAQTHAPEPKEGQEAVPAPADAQAPVEEEEEPTEAGKPADDPAKAKLGRPKKDPNARVIDAARKEKAAREALVAERAERARIEAKLREIESERSGKTEPEQPKSAPKADGRPKSDDFATWEQYEDALLEWRLAKAENERSEKARGEAINAKKSEQISAFNKRMQEAIQADPTFSERVSQDVIELVPSMLLPPGEKAGPLNALADRFIVSEVGPALMMYFTDHPEDVQRLSQMYPADFWMELGYIERGLVSAPSLPQATNPSISKAKPPVRPVAGSSIGGDEGNLDDLPVEEYIRRMNARELKARR